MLPQLHLLRNSLREARRLGDELRWGFFKALHTGARPGGYVHRDVVPQNKVQDCDAASTEIRH